MHYRYVTVENIVRKGEIACNKQFLLFSQCFLHYMTLIFHFKCNLKMSSAICFNLDQSKILSSGNGLIHPLSANTLNALLESIYFLFGKELISQIFFLFHVRNSIDWLENLDPQPVRAFVYANYKKRCYEKLKIWLGQIIALY